MRQGLFFSTEIIRSYLASILEEHHQL